MTLTLGSAIYIAVKPLIKIYLNGALGFLLAKKNVFTIETCQRISVLIIKFLLPALIFNNVIQSLSGSEIKDIGLVTLTAFLYEAIGLCAGAVIWYLTPNPRNWLGGVLIAAAFNNCSDLPIAYVTTLARGPYLPDNAGHMGTAYSVIFMVVFIVSLFNLGGVRLLQRDFQYKLDDPERRTPTQPILAKVLVGSFKTVSDKSRSLCRRRDEQKTESREAVVEEVHTGGGAGAGSSDSDSAIIATAKESSSCKGVKQYSDYPHDRARRSSFGPRNLVPLRHAPPPPTLSRSFSPQSWDEKDPGVTFREQSHSPLDIYATPNVVDKLRPIRTAPESLDDIVVAFHDSGNENDYPLPTGVQRVLSAPGQFPGVGSFSEVSTRYGQPPIPATSRSSVQSTLFVEDELAGRDGDSNDQSRGRKIWHGLKDWIIQFFKDLKRPQSIALIVSMTFTMIPWVRRLFYLDPTTNNTYGMPQAPDGLPILDFAIDFTSFIGGACVPLGLAMLGATIARINIKNLPKNFWQSAVMMSLFKLVVLPIIGLLWVNKLQHLHWLGPSDKMASFVMIVTSGVPTSTTQLYITAMLTQPGDSHDEIDCLAAYLLTQYIFMFITMTILVTYTLKNIVPL